MNYIFSDVTDTTLEQIATTCSRLTEINLRHCTSVTHTGLAIFFLHFPFLERIYLQGLEMSDVALDALCSSHSSRLTHLDIDGTTGLSKQSLLKLSQFTSIVSLKLSWLEGSDATG